MMKRILFLAAAAAFAAGQAHAGGRLEQSVLTGAETIPGFIDTDVVPIFWDDRCTNVSYTLDTVTATGAFGPIPVATIRDELQAAFDSWNKIPTSYIRMTIDNVRTIGNGTRRFDFINELTFETPPGSGFLASSPSTSLIADAEFVVGDDIDGDGDSDVYDPAVEGRDTCFDADGDGDIEFSAGFYKGGTILDNDVQFNDFAFNPATFPIAWETTPGSTIGAAPRAADIRAIAVHEFGHSHSLAHSLINQISDTDGSGSTMFPFIDIDDGDAEATTRTLHVDDIAWSSFVYPEGSQSSGPAALQPGDRRFSKDFEVITGSLTQNGFGVLGGNVQATTRRRGGQTLGEGYSGFTRVYTRIADGACCFIFDLPSSAIDGDFEIPVPRGAYDLSIEALDGDPAAPGNISFTAIIGNAFGQHAFPEEFRGVGPLEDNIEFDPGFSVPVPAIFNGGPNISIVTNDEIRLRNAGALTNIGTGAAIGVQDVIYAERFAGSTVRTLIEGGAVPTTGLFRTGVFDASTVGVFESAGLYYGTVNADGTASIDLSKAIYKENEFVGQDGDLTPLFFNVAPLLAKKIEKRLADDPTLDLFLVLAAKNNPNLGDSGLPPLLGLSAAAPTGNSFLSVAGGPFAPRPNNWIVELRFTDSNL